MQHLQKKNILQFTILGRYDCCVVNNEKDYRVGEFVTYTHGPWNTSLYESLNIINLQ